MTGAAGSAHLHKLALLSMLMSDRDEAEILQLADATCPTIAPGARFSFRVSPAGWWPHTPEEGAARSVVAFDAPGIHLLEGTARPVYVVPVRCRSMRVGCLVVESDAPLGEDPLFGLHVLGQQLAVALDNARRLARERAKVSELRELLDAHEHLTQVAARGEGVPGILTALTELCGRPTILEDAQGAVLAAAGEWPTGGRRSARARATLLEQLRREPRPVRAGSEIAVLAGHLVEPTAVLRVHDWERSADERDLMTISYAATIIAMERARSAQVAEAELRLHRELVEQLLQGLPDRLARPRADAIGVDLDVARRVAVVRQTAAVPGSAEELILVVKRTLDRLGFASLPVTRGSDVICVTEPDADWAAALRAIEQDPAGAACQVGVGSVCTTVGDYPISLRHALQALVLAGRTGGRSGIVRFDDLGVYRLLALNNDPGELDAYIEQWLGALVRYDRARATELVATLESYLETGGSIAATAEAMRIHRSTVKYRMQRMAELTGCDINDSGVRFSVQLALYALRTRTELFSA